MLGEGGTGRQAAKGTKKRAGLFFAEAMEFSDALDQIPEAGGFAAAGHFVLDDVMDEEGIVGGAVSLFAFHADAKRGEKIA